MHSKLKFSNLRISTKLLLVNLLTCAAFILIVVIVVSSFFVVRNKVTGITTRDVSAIIANSQTSHEISKVFTDIDYLSRTFYGNKDFLKSEGSRLLNDLNNISDSNTYPELKKPLITMSDNLNSFLSWCAKANNALNAIKIIQREAHNELTGLENLIANLLVRHTLEGEDISFLEQLLTLVVGYKESLLEIGKLFAELGHENYFLPVEGQKSPLISTIDDLNIRLRTITASIPDIARYGKKISTNVKNYKAAVLNFYKLMKALNLQLVELKNNRALSMSVMTRIDEKIFRGTQLVNNSIKKIITSSVTAVIILSVLVIISMSFAIFYINRSNINWPMREILKGLESFRKGNFKTQIELGRKDEWDVIEKAFNKMAAELFVSYNELDQRVKERTAELTATNQQLAMEIGERERTEKRYRDLFDEAPVMYIITQIKDDRPIIVNCNKMFLSTLGYSRKKVINRFLEDFYTPKSCTQLIEGGGYRDALEGRFNIQERQLIGHDGRVIETVLRALPELDRDGKVCGTRAMFVDITDRKRAEEGLNTEKERLAVTLQSIGDGVITTDRKGHITLINRIAEGLTGWTQPEVTGLPLNQVFKIINEITRVPCDDPVKHVIKSGKIVGLANNTVLISRNGNEYLIADSGAPIFDTEKRIIGVVLVFRDVTDKRRMESEILKIEKLESLGVLAGGIAHDFNNLLVGIIGNLSLVKLSIGVTDVVYPKLQEMEKAALRAKDLTQQLLTFSKGGDPVKKTVELTQLVKESALFALRGSNVRCDFAFKTKSFFSEVDEGQISQVIQNLILNADQAMPEGGVIQIGGEKIKMPSNKAFPLNAGEYVKLTIQDQGIGIKKEQLKKVFDPYFTTKQKGSGLGLAVVYSIIDKHNGWITIDSKLGEGTTFSVYLPATHEIKPKQIDAEISIKSGIGKILVMDDEDFIRKLASQMLRKMGYTVTLAKDGEEAIQLYKKAFESGRAFDAVILDLTVPGGMGGKETIRELLLIDKNVKAIVSSGYSNDPVMSNYGRYGFKEAVKKPYPIQEISEALEFVIRKSM